MFVTTKVGGMSGERKREGVVFEQRGWGVWAADWAFTVLLRFKFLLYTKAGPPTTQNQEQQGIPLHTHTNA